MLVMKELARRVANLGIRTSLIMDLRLQDQIRNVIRVALVLLLALSNEARVNGYGSSEQCEYSPELAPRPHSVSILEFGAVGDGKTLNTIAFQNAIFYLMSFADKGGTQLYVPPGQWLTGSFNLTSHLTLFLERGAVIIGFQDPFYWEVINLLPSCGQGIKAPAGRYLSLINGYMLNDVVITGNTGTIDGVGSIWWRSFTSHSLNYSRPHLIKLVASNSVVVSNITFLNTLTYGIHSVYCSNVHIHNISISAPSESPFTVGIVPDSSDNVCIEDCTISMGFDAIALKSGWDEYGIAYGRPTKNNHQGKRWLHEGDSYIRHSYIEEHDWYKILKLLDLAGYGVAVAVSKEFKGSFRGLTYKSPLLDLMIKSGRNGKNNGKGYYFYEKGSKPKPDLSILPIVEESRRLANIMPGGKPIFITDQEIVEMILFLIVNEACRVLDEGMVIQASDLDIACGLGMSFPSYRWVYPFFFLSSPACFMISFLVGAKHVYNSLKKLSELYGNFYKPSRYLEERAIQGIPLIRFYICYFLFEFHGI
ncbi:hypothetical protein Ahy_B04g071427 [Arachis hypogaea]|uniref:Pectate lyase superfamily protein domain-containing protein n=1 Tax=Arachis hypogaea TaxID=3818 RepID=A0A444ZKR6_ARAHY|nr:hypothetical protein Ahy_B04g071427 [Arachis hypogaea]